MFLCNFFSPELHNLQWHPLCQIILIFKVVGAADKAAIQLVKVQPDQLLVSDT